MLDQRPLAPVSPTSFTMHLRRRAEDTGAAGHASRNCLWKTSSLSFFSRRTTRKKARCFRGINRRFLDFDEAIPY